MVTLTNVGTTYDAITASQGLGMGLMDLTGITQLKVVLKVQKIGTGTQTWQVWNETDSVSIGEIPDAGAAAIRNLTATFPVNLTGEKLIRIRAKSTVSTDDPVYLAGTILAT
jgi:hypothetical protein